MKRLLFLICTLLCANVLFAQVGTTFWIGDLQYEITSTNPAEVEVNDANLSITTANIPETVTYQGTTNSVTSIGENAFRDCSSLTSVTIPNSVTSIGNIAFANCSSLTYITIPNSVTSIGAWVFYNCSSLTSITIPNSVTSIEDNAFRDCSSLTSVTIPNSVTSIGEGAFNYCTSLESINLSDNIASIGRNCFDSCINLTNVNIPTSLSVIDTSLFRYCTSLTSVTIPENITYIKAWAFIYCSSLTSITCLRSNSPSLGNGYVFDGTPNNKTLTISCGYESEYADWQNATTWASIDCIVITGSRFTIGDLTYKVTSETEVKVQGCTQSATSVVIPSTITYQGTTYDVTSIASGAFWGCSSLTSVTIPNSVTSIGNAAFEDCSSLTSVTIPNSVTSIEAWVFYNCSSLTSITIPNSVTSIEGGAFSGCSSLTSVTIPNSVTSIGYDAFRGCSSLTSVTIPNSVTSIGEYAFQNCSSLTSVTIPNSVTYIGNYAFQNCSSLTSVDIPNSITHIGIYAFYNCSSLTSITIPNSVTFFGYQAFYYCSSLTSINIDLPSIGNIFVGCNSLQNLTLGENVTSIASGAFNGCSFLQNVNCLATTPPTLADNTVFPYPNIASLKVPCGSLEAYSAPTSFWNMFFAGRISENGYNVEVSVNDETFGSVAVESDCYTGTLTATANEGYVFLSWNDGNTENPRVVSLTSDTSFVANFIISTVNTDITATICQGQTYTENGFNVSEAGTYTQTLTAINGADSIVTLTLNVNPIYNTDLVASICDGEVYNENGFNVNEAGVYTQTLQALNGCDSIVTLTLSVNPVFNTNLSAFICEGETYTENGFNVSEAGVYTQSLQSVNGCDSIVTLTLNVNPIFHTELSATICEGSVYNDNGFNVSEAGTYTQNLTTANGCDSIVTLALTVLPSYNTNLTATICEGSELNISGFHVTEGGVYTQTYTAVNGCDSIVTLTVTELPTIHTNLTLTICEGTSLNFSGFNVSEAGVYTQTYTAVNGCDSIVTLTVTELPIIHTDLTLTICEGTSLNFSGFNVSEAGIYTQNLTSVNGCDSIVTLTVSVNPVFDTTINATINPGETYAEFGFNESESGTYVQNLQTEAGCDSTITLNLTVNSSLYDVAEFAELSVYPNPTSGKVTFSKEIEKIEVIDLSGKTLQTYENANEINIEALPAGVYHLRMTIGDKTTTRKVIKE